MEDEDNINRNEIKNELLKEYKNFKKGNYEFKKLRTQEDILDASYQLALSSLANGFELISLLSSPIITQL